SGGWAMHCVKVCNQWGIHICKTVLTPATRDHLDEAAYRNARYAWFESLIQPGDVLVTAHHRDDQVETVLYRLLRGSGVHGLGGIQPERPFGSGVLARPFLGCSRSDITAYATEQGLSWVTDPSNEDRRYDRNFLRHEIIRPLAARWPASGRSIDRAARHLRHAHALLEEIARQDYDELWEPAANCCLGHHGCMGVVRLEGLSVGRRFNLLRYWMSRNGYQPSGTKRLDELWRQANLARGDGNVRVAWPDAEFRRFRAYLYLLPRQLMGPLPDSISWTTHIPIQCPGVGLRLHARVSNEGSLRLKPEWSTRLELSWLRRRVRLKPTGGQHRRRLRNIFQESRIPPWERRRLPMISRDGVAIGIPGVVLVDGFAAAAGHEGVEICLEDLLLRRDGGPL
ncbi:MAG TPA: tRNA lysidine(34) synthetase TilS, partial [Gammaproteobacteria bacterium]|nr:tRNA lysidine(34) synthetase TilS [Gammaproteobacteria bacterium]